MNTTENQILLLLIFILCIGLITYYCDKRENIENFYDSNLSIFSDTDIPDAPIKTAVNSQIVDYNRIINKYSKINPSINVDNNGKFCDSSSSLNLCEIRTGLPNTPIPNTGLPNATASSNNYPQCIVNGINSSCSKLFIDGYINNNSTIDLNSFISGLQSKIISESKLLIEDIKYRKSTIDDTLHLLLNKQDLIKTGKLLQGIGNRRLLGFGITTTGLPVTLVAGFQAINDVSNEELNSLRRFVPEWAKNSTLIPVGRNEKGYLKYIDFGYANAYDPLIRPFGAIMTELAQGNATKESLMASLGKGLMQGTSELLKPFTSESIYTEALIDSVLRKGIDKEGKRIWSQEDDPFVKVLKSVNHIAKTFTPGSYSQLKRISEAAVGKSDQYGRKYELKDH